MANGLGAKIETAGLRKKIRKLQNEKVLLLDALRKIAGGNHLDTCQWMLSWEYPCNCHVSIARTAYRNMEE